MHQEDTKLHSRFVPEVSKVTKRTKNGFYTLEEMLSLAESGLGRFTLYSKELGEFVTSTDKIDSFVKKLAILMPRAHGSLEKKFPILIEALMTDVIQAINSRNLASCTLSYQKYLELIKPSWIFKQLIPRDTKLKLECPFFHFVFLATLQIVDDHIDDIHANKTIVKQLVKHWNHKNVGHEIKLKRFLTDYLTAQGQHDAGVDAFDADEMAFVVARFEVWHQQAKLESAKQKTLLAPQCLNMLRVISMTADEGGAEVSLPKANESGVCNSFEEKEDLLVEQSAQEEMQATVMRLKRC